jgi:hypothetical protein
VKTVVAILSTAVLLVGAATADARVRLLSVSSPVSRGNAATLVARVSPAQSCSITVYYKSGPSQAKGLYRKRPVGGVVTWSWIVGTRTTPGRWPIVVSCGAAGTLRTSFAVVR